MNGTRLQMLEALNDYVQAALHEEGGSIEEAVPGDLDGFIEDVALWMRAHDLDGTRYENEYGHVAAYEAFCSKLDLDPNTVDAFDEWAEGMGEARAEASGVAIAAKYPATDPGYVNDDTCWACDGATDEDVHTYDDYCQLTAPAATCDGDELVTRWRDIDGTLCQKRYLACAECGADLTEPDDVYATRSGATPARHMRGAAQ